MKPLVTYGVFCGISMRFVCDRKCEKAWGINLRPRVPDAQIDEKNRSLMHDDADAYEHFADGELGEAPTNPGSYEGEDGKPFHPAAHNKWCVRECERCSTRSLNEPLLIHDYASRQPNLCVDYLKRRRPELVKEIDEKEADVHRR